MSIEEIIRFRCGDGTLYPINPSVSSDPIIRGLYVSADIHDHLIGQESLEVPWGLARSIMDTFVSGKLISVARGRNNRKHTFMGHLDPQTDGMWTMKPSKPSPGIRIFGQFAKRDLFIALDWEDRLYLEDYNSRLWKRAIRNCKQKWATLFNPYTPVTEDNSHAYLSNIILV